jgi:hypothetical protein
MLRMYRIERLVPLIGATVAGPAYIDAELPNYLQFEHWVGNHIKRGDESTKAKWTAEIAAMQKAEDQAAAEVVEAGATDPTIRGTVLLNDMVDWKHMHDHIISQRVART